MYKHPDWNPDIEPGQKVVHIGNGFRRATYTIRTVERLTATQVVCSNNVRLDRKTGRKLGEHYTHYQLFTPEIQAQMDKENREWKLRDWAKHDSSKHIEKLTVEQIEQVQAMVDSFAKQNQEATQGVEA